MRSGENHLEQSKEGLATEMDGDEPEVNFQGLQQHLIWVNVINFQSGYGLDN